MDDKDGYSETQGLQPNYDFEFSEQSIRHGFIRKVYGILLCQLAVTMTIMSLFLYIEPLREYSKNHVWLYIVALIATFICLIVLACCPDVRRNSPQNFIFLGVFTLCEAYLLGAISACYSADAVLWAVAITAVISLSLTIFAFQTKWDFTMCSGGLLVALIVLLMFGFLCAIIRNHYLNIVYASIGALIFGLYLVFDTQLMMGGKHQYALSPEEYIFAALNLYLDIVNLFIFILQLVGNRS